VRFDYEAATGRLTPRQAISTLPPGFAGSNFCSEILVSADGRFVYAGNRLHDSIAIFSVRRFSRGSNFSSSHPFFFGGPCSFPRF
jgi:6-phosphogluconolactonase (cycloisomerase 2 family)